MTHRNTQYWLYGTLPVKIEPGDGGGLRISVFDDRTLEFKLDASYYTEILHDRDNMTRQLTPEEFDAAVRDRLERARRTTILEFEVPHRPELGVQVPRGARPLGARLKAGRVVIAARVNTGAPLTLLPVVLLRPGEAWPDEPVEYLATVEEHGRAVHVLVGRA